MEAEGKRVDEYGLGTRESLAEAVNAVINILGMKPCEVRDRTTLYLSTLAGDGAVAETDKDVKEFLFGSLDVPLVNLERSLRKYGASEEPFDISTIPKEVKSQPLAEKKAPGKKPSGIGAPPSGPTSAADTYEKLLSSIPEFSSFGKLFKSSAPVELTEAVTEYAVNVVKHIYDGHIVFQYNYRNTIPEQLLESVTIFVDASETEEFSEVASKPLKALPYDSWGRLLWLLRNLQELLENSQTF